MDRVATLFYPVFLPLLCLQALAGYVEPPINVTLHCRNLHNVLSWSYDQPSPGLRFKVFIGSLISSPPTEIWIDPPALQVDLSMLSKPDEDYFLTVTAVIGNNESEPSPPDGITFSYFKDSQAMQKCFVDLPSVNVTAQKEDIVQLRFVHPWLFYHKLHGSPKSSTRKRRGQDPQISPELPEFTYNVVILNQKEQPHDFTCEDNVCEETIPVDATQQKHCLKITGEMQKMAVYATQDYCAGPFDKTPDTIYYLLILMTSVLGLSALVCILFMVYRKWTKPPSSLPDSVNIRGRLKHLTFGVIPEQVSVLEVDPHSPTLLLPTPEITKTPVSPYDLRLPIGVSTEDEGAEEDEEVRNDEGSEYMQGRGLEDDEEQNAGEIRSDYEKRQVLIEISPGEQAEGYRA